MPQKDVDRSEQIVDTTWEFDYSRLGDLQRTQLFTQFAGEEENTQSCLGYAPFSADPSDVKTTDWQAAGSSGTDAFIKLQAYAMPCGMDFYKNDNSSWKGYATYTRPFSTERCIAYSWTFNAMAVNLNVPVLDEFVFSLPKPNLKFEVIFCFPNYGFLAWYGAELSQWELSITIFSTEVLRVKYRFFSYGAGIDQRTQVTTAKGMGASKDIMFGNLRSLLQENNTVNSSQSKRGKSKRQGHWHRNLTMRTLRMEAGRCRTPFRCLVASKPSPEAAASFRPQHSGSKLSRLRLLQGTRPVVDEVLHGSRAQRKLRGRSFHDRFRRMSLSQAEALFEGCLQRKSVQHYADPPPKRDQV